MAVEKQLYQNKQAIDAKNANKVDRSVDVTNGKSLVSNNPGDGGAVMKFEHTDGTWSAIGINNGGKDGIAGQLYVIDGTDATKGCKINMTKGMFTYIKDKATSEATAADEIAVKGDIAGKADTTALNIEIEARAAADLALKKMVDDEKTRAVTEEAKKIELLGNETGSGKPYNMTYFYEMAAEQEKIVATVKTITLDNKKTLGSYSMDIPKMTSATAGLYTKSIDDTLVKHTEMKPMTTTEIDALIGGW